MTAELPVQVRKEVRAQLPLWLGAVVAMILANPLDARWQPFGDSGPHVIGIVVYWIGAVALGAFAFGQEYTYRTLAGLLSQPVARTRLFIIKLAVLSGFALALSAVAAIVLFDEGHALLQFDPHSSRSWFELSAFVMPFLLTVCLAPWITMLCRNPLAAGVVTLLIPPGLALLGEVVGLARYGLTRPVMALVERTMRGVVLWGIAFASVAGLLVSAWTFGRLQAFDSWGIDLHLARWGYARAGAAARTTNARRRHRMWLLLKKELHVQQWTFVVAGIYVLAWAGARLRMLKPRPRSDENLAPF